MPKIVDHERYRQELLSKCLNIFADQGYGALTMRQLAQELEVSTGTLYHYFPNKEGIFIQLVQELCEQGISNFFAHAPAAETLDERLRIVMTFFLESYQFYQQQILLWVDFHQHSQHRTINEQQFLRGVWQRTHDQLAAYLYELRPAHIDFVLVFMDGLLLQFLYNHGQEEQEWVTQQVEILIGLIASI